MPALLKFLADEDNAVLPHFFTKTRHPSRLSTSFDDCFMLRKTGESRTVGRFDKRPCRSHEEDSCNKVHATCARVLKKGTAKVSNRKMRGIFDAKGPPCTPPKPPPGEAVGDKEAEGKGGKMGKLAGAAKAASAAAAALMSGSGDCNARLEDYPYGLMNPEAVKDETRNIMHQLGLTRSVFANPTSSVWGLIVHGLSGTFGFDNHGSHSTDYIYKIKQPNGVAPDFYVCDSRTHPQRCALLGGNMQHNCGEWYDPQMCNYCQDHGAMLTCQVRGWNSKYFEWVKVPIYPRDLLGEMYRGEFRDVAARPMYSTITVPKELLRQEMKDMPDYMVMDGEAMQIMKKYGNGPESPQHALLAFATGSEAPDPRLVGLLPEYETFATVDRCKRSDAMQRKKRCEGVRDFL